MSEAIPSAARAAAGEVPSGVGLERILKRDDLRGRYPDELDEATAYALGRALMRSIFAGVRPAIAVGWDGRSSSACLANALMAGLSDAGARVLSLGLTGTELVYYAVGRSELSGGVMVTASHNPKDENGFKVVARGARPIEADEFRQIDAAYRAVLAAGPADLLDVSADYADTLLRLSGIDAAAAAGPRMRIVVEAGNGVAASVFRSIAARLPLVDVVYSNAEPDGRFPRMLPNPLDPDYMALVRQRVLAESADLGFGFDGDADRVGVVTDQGEVLTSSECMALMIERLLARRPADRKIMFNLVCSRLVADVTRAMDGVPWMTPIGHGQIKLRMRRLEHADCIFAGEHSGHYFFREFFHTDSAMLSALMILAAAREAGASGLDLHARVAGWRRKYIQSHELNFDLRRADPGSGDTLLRRAMQCAVARVRSAYAGRGRELRDYAPGDPVKAIKGVAILRMDFTEPWGEWWLCVRPSGNEPLLRLNLEVVLNDDQIGRADALALLGERREALIDLIGRATLLSPKPD